MKAVFHHQQEAAANISIYWFEKPKDFRYIAGQYTELFLPHSHSDERGQRRWFTLSSSPSEEMLAITTKFSQLGSTFKTRLHQLKPGDTVNLAEPMGDFVLPKDPSIPLVFVAGGIGCTPYRSIIKSLIDNQEKRDISLIYGAASQKEIAFGEIFSSLKNKFQPIIGDNLTANQILRTAKADQYIYLAGPETMVENLQADLIAAGQDKRFIYTDFFHNY